MERTDWLMTAGHLPVPMTPEQMQAWTLQRELDERNRPMTDDEIEALLPAGYKVSQRLACYCISQSKQIYEMPVNVAVLWELLVGYMKELGY